MSNKNILYFGTEASLPERIPLRAGPLSMFYEQGDLRTIKLGNQEILRRIYVAIRDRNWSMIMPHFSNIQMEIQADAFQITYEVENIQNEIDFAWKGEITGDPHGRIVFRMDGLARTTFQRNRIGFCVLHPAACAGATALIDHVDGTTEQGTFPELISADQPVLPFAELRSLHHQVVPGIWAELYFSGDIFEMEDQRNWTDASYKTFCTPLRLPYPVPIEAGTRIEQSIILAMRNKGNAVPQDNSLNTLRETPPITFSLENGKIFPLPRLGLGAASHRQPLNDTEVERLQALHLDHLRVDLQLAEPGFLGQLSCAAAEAAALSISLEAALLIGDPPDEGFNLLTEALASLKPPIQTWLIYPIQENFLGGSPTRRVLEAAHRHLDGLIPGARFGAGTNTDFIFMQRSPPPLGLIDLVTFAVNPQVHAFDNASIVETCSVQGAAVRTALRLAGGKPVFVSPVTLKPRFNAYATASTPPPPPGELPPQVDPRQMSLLGAGWTAASLKYLAESGAQSITVYETTGWRGVMETAQGSPLPDQFHSKPASVFPLYHVLADYGEFAGGECVQSISSDPLRVDGIALHKDNNTRIILANLTAHLQTVSLRELQESVQVRMLDETNAEEAMLKPESYRLTPGNRQATVNGQLKLNLLPYAVGFING
jgi:hypothetical protein